MQIRIRRWLGTAASVLLLALLSAALLFPPAPVERFSMAVRDVYQIARPRPYQPEQAVRIADIDDTTLAKVGQWPWPRTLVAQLVERLEALGARLVVFDVVFAEPDRTSPASIAGLLGTAGALPEIRQALMRLPDHDQVLASAIGMGGRTVLGFSVRAEPTASMPRQVARLRVDPATRFDTFLGAIPNLPKLEAAAAGNGHFNMEPDSDGLVRVVPLLLRLRGPAGDTVYPSIDLEAVRLLEDTREISPLVDPDSGRLNFLRVGRIRIPLEPGGNFRVAWSGSNPDRSVPVHTILDGTVDPARIRDRVVLIGTSAKGLLDLRATPLDNIVAGVENHAEIIEQIRARHWLTIPGWARAAESLFLLGGGLVVIWIAIHAGAGRAAAVLLLLLAVAAAGSWILFRQGGVLLDPATPSLALLLTYGAAAWNAFARSDDERRQVREAFGRYLAPALVERLAAHPERLKLGGELREMTVLFTDIRGFTARSETLDPEALTALLNGFLTPMTATLLQHGGTIDKYIGDAIMAFWNAPLADERHAANACAAAVAMLDALDRINAAHPERPPIEIGIGINSGPCCVGNLGSEQRFAYSAIGDAVNLAARIEGQTRPYRVPVLIGETTRNQAPEFLALEADRIRVKGKTEAVRVYALLDNGSSRTPAFDAAEATHMAMLAAYRGRAWAECGALLDELEQALPRLGGLYGLYRERCAAFLAAPPPADWDGIWVAAGK